MPATKKVIQRYLIECEEHLWLSLALTHERNADEIIMDHNRAFHSDPEKEETWPTNQ